MNCYVGLAKRLVNSCFPPVIPVPQLEPLDARNIIKQEVQLITTNKACFALSDANERVNKPKPISEEEAWEATLAWAEAKAQEREAAAIKAASQTDTDESYDSDDDDFCDFGVPIQPVLKSALFAGDDEDSSGDESGVYEGERNVAGQMEGRGIERYADGAVYEGEFKADKREGRGKYVWPSGAVYDGEWKADKIEGCGKYVFADGDVYEGEFKAGKQEGRGIYRYANGDVYEGEWKANEYYDSDFDDDFSVCPPAMAGLMRAPAVVRAKAYSLDDAAAAAAMWRDDAQADAYECVAAKKALEALDKLLPSPRKYTAATIIQAAERGRVVRVGVAALAAVWTEWAVERRACGERAVTKAATIIQAAARGRAVRAWNVFRPAPTIYDSPAAWYREAYRATFKLNGTLRRPLTPPRRRLRSRLFL
jgi:hypothetical protein